MSSACSAGLFTPWIRIAISMPTAQQRHKAVRVGTASRPPEFRSWLKQTSGGCQGCLANWDRIGLKYLPFVWDKRLVFSRQTRSQHLTPPQVLDRAHPNTTVGSLLVPLRTGTWNLQHRPSTEHVAEVRMSVVLLFQKKNTLLQFSCTKTTERTLD